MNFLLKSSHYENWLLIIINLIFFASIYVFLNKLFVPENIFKLLADSVMRPAYVYLVR